MADTHGSTRSGTLRTIFLDRDGVLNEKMSEGRYVGSWADFRILPTAPEALAKLNRAGLRIIVVSNQRGIALGLYSEADVDAIHAEFQKILGQQGAHIDAFYICPHDRQDCNCRKPLPGMYEQAQHDFPDISPETSLMVGDSLSDIEFGRRLGMRTVFIEGDPDRRKNGADEALRLADFHFASLAGAVAHLLDNQ